MRDELKVYVIIFVFGVLICASFLWVGLGMHFPHEGEAETVSAEGVTRETETIRDGVATLAIEAETEIESEIETETEIETEKEIVTADHSMVLDDDERDLLAALVYSEAGDQDLYGMRLVVDVVFNRCDSDLFPDTISGVVFQQNQFEVVGNGALDRAYAHVTDDCYLAIQMELDERIDYNILYFSMGDYGLGDFVFRHGDHWFYE